MLENILIDYFGLPEDWNNDYESAEKNWNIAYNKLIDLVWALGELGVIDDGKVVDELDEIHNIEE